MTGSKKAVNFWENFGNFNVNFNAILNANFNAKCVNFWGKSVNFSWILKKIHKNCVNFFGFVRKKREFFWGFLDFFVKMREFFSKKCIIASFYVAKSWRSHILQVIKLCKVQKNSRIFTQRLREFFSKSPKNSRIFSLFGFKNSQKFAPKNHKFLPLKIHKIFDKNSVNFLINPQKIHGFPPKIHPKALQKGSR